MSELAAYMHKHGLTSDDVLQQLLTKGEAEAETEVESGHPMSLKLLAHTKPIRLFGRDVVAGPLIEQCPFLPEDLRPIDFKAGTKTIYQLSAPCGSGKSPTMAYLSAVAQSAGCWVLVLLNIPNNQAIESLAEKFHEIYEKLGVDDQRLVTDDVFRKSNDKHFKNRCDSLKNAKHTSLWICKAEERQLSKLIAGVPPEAWSRCVVMFDEVHCFFSLQDKCRKKAEVNMWSMLFGADTKEESHVSTMRVRSVLFSDATDGDLPHVLRHRFNCKSGEFTRICADMERLRDRGYVSTADHVLFEAEGVAALATPPNKAQWFGKDIRETMPNESGAHFAASVRLEHFEPNLRAFCKDAFEVPCAAGGFKFMLELTSVNKSEGGSNSVEHHAEAIARLFPSVLAMAQHGGGCFHFDERSVRTWYASHADAHKALSSTDKYRGKPKYMITNIGYGSMTYGLPGAPVTHLYLGFKKEDNNILVKAQGAGRGCGYVRDDLAKCGGRVLVLCTPHDFQDMQSGLSTFTKEAYEQYPDHAVGDYTNRIVRDSQVGHAANPLAARARLTATVPNRAPLASDGTSSNVTATTTVPNAVTAPQDRTALYASVEEAVEVNDDGAATPSYMLLQTPSLVVSEATAHVAAIKALHPGTVITTRVIFIKGNIAQHKEQCAKLKSVKTALGQALRTVQHDALPNGTPNSGHCSHAVSNFYNGNPAHCGSKHCKTPEAKYRMLWAYDTQACRMVGVVRTVALRDLVLPFIHHRMDVDADGSVHVSAILIREKQAGDKRRSGNATRCKKRAATGAPTGAPKRQLRSLVRPEALCLSMREQ